jgi:hypothetical protein
VEGVCQVQKEGGCETYAAVIGSRKLFICQGFGTCRNVGSMRRGCLGRLARGAKNQIQQAIALDNPCSLTGAKGVARAASGTGEFNVAQFATWNEPVPHARGKGACERVAERPGQSRLVRPCVQPCEPLRTRGFYSPSCSFASQRTVTNKMANDHVRSTPCTPMTYGLGANTRERVCEQAPRGPRTGLRTTFARASCVPS